MLTEYFIRIIPGINETRHLYAVCIVRVKYIYTVQSKTFLLYSYISFRNKLYDNVTFVVT